MPLELRQVTSANEVPEIVEGWLKNERHLTPALESVDWGTDESSHRDRIEELSARHWFRHSTTPGAVWLKVVDTELGDKVVAASQWRLQTEPVSGEVAQPTRAYWLPPGPVRKLYEGMRNNFAAVRNGPTRRQPHVHLRTTYTLAEHRRRGANTLMMEWGTEKADELGLETWLEASPMGSMLYARHGFGILHQVELRSPTELREANDECRQWDEATKDSRVAVMKRPVNGLWTEDRLDATSFPAYDLVRNVWLK